MEFFEKEEGYLLKIRFFLIISLFLLEYYLYDQCGGCSLSPPPHLFFKKKIIIYYFFNSISAIAISPSPGL